MLQAYTRLTYWLRDQIRRDDEGDVPGWVMVTMMTAGLVVLLWGVAGDKLQQMFTNALDGVTGPGK